MANKTKIFDYLRKAINNRRGANYSWLHNVYLLYFLLFVALSTLLGFVLVQDYTSAVILLLVGFITSFFSKNMVVVLVVAISFSQIVRLVLSDSARKEGFQEGAETGTPEEAAMKMENVDKIASEASDSIKESEKAADATVAESGKVAANVERNARFDEIKKDTEKLKEMEKSAIELLNVQQELLNGLQKMEPMLNRAESLSTKLENFSDKINSVKK